MARRAARTYLRISWCAYGVRALRAMIMKEVDLKVNKVLIVEGNFRTAERLRRALSDAQTQVHSCRTLEEAIALLGEERYQMLIIDSVLSDVNVHALMQTLEIGMDDPARPSVILMVPNNGRTPATSELNEQGIADYITKPFNTAVLKAKVLTQFARRNKEYDVSESERFEAIGSGSAISMVGEHRVVIDDFVFDFDAKEYSVAGRKVRLNCAERCLLRTFVENKGIVLKKKALIDKLRAESRICMDEGTLMRTIQTLNDKLEAKAYIKKIYAIGYIWIDAEEKEQGRHA